MRRILTTAGAGFVACALLVGACSSDSTDDVDADATLEVVVTTSILADVVDQAFGELVDVELIMPTGADPHDFAPSARQAETMERAGLLVVNGAGFEEGMSDVIDAAAETAPLFVATDAVDLLPAGSDDDPHFWTDPTRMVDVVDALGERLTELLDGSFDAADVEAAADVYRSELVATDLEVEKVLATVPADRRVLVTSHEVFGYLAARYDYEVVGAIVPSATTGAEASAAQLDDLASLIETEQVPAIFVEHGQSADLADALADQAGGVDVVALYSESLGEPGSEADTYTSMLRTNAQLIADALGRST